MTDGFNEIEGHVTPEQSVIRVEELDQKIRELLAAARSEGQAIRRANQAATGMTYRSVPTPDIDDQLFQDLKLALEDEVVAAVPTTETGGILPWELNQELMKKALVGVKAPALRQLARDARLPTSGRLELVATRIAQYYHWDEHQIAQAILAAEGQLEPTSRAHHDRLVPLETAPDFEYVLRRLEYVVKRYIRVGIARWFVFDEVEGDADHLRLSGTVQSYRAYVDDTGEEPSVGATPSERRVDIALDAGRELARVRRASFTDARSAMHALATAANVRSANFVPMRAIDGLVSWALDFDRTTLFALDLLATRLRQQGLHRFDMKVARFKLAEEQEPDDPRPSLEAVRFEGRHILDSIEACRLIATEGRALVGFSLDAETPRRPDQESATFPLHVTVDDWSVVVSTGLGTAQSELSVAAHQALIEAVTDELQDGIADVAALNDLAERIADRATLPGVPDHADMLADPESNEY